MQARKKALTALLLSHGLPPPRARHLDELLTMAEPFAPDLASMRTRLLSLDAYSLPTRYPDALPPPAPPAQDEAREALAVAEAMVEFVDRLLSP